MVLLAACNAGESGGTKAPSGGRPRLVLPGTPANVTVQLPAKARQLYVHGSGIVCLDGPGEVKVTSVGFQSGALEVTGWAVRPLPEPDQNGTTYLAGDRPGATLKSRGIENTEVLTRSCEGPLKPYEVVLQLRAGESSTQGEQVIVEYTSDGREGTVAVPERVVLCVRPEKPACR
jgi:hypothetical protein